MVSAEGQASERGLLFPTFCVLMPSTEVADIELESGFLNLNSVAPRLEVRCQEIAELVRDQGARSSFFDVSDLNLGRSNNAAAAIADGSQNCSLCGLSVRARTPTSQAGEA